MTSRLHSSGMSNLAAAAPPHQRSYAARRRGEALAMSAMVLRLQAQGWVGRVVVA